VGAYYVLVIIITSPHLCCLLHWTVWCYRQNCGLFVTVVSVDAG